MGSVIEVPEWLVKSKYAYAVRSRDGERTVILSPETWWNLYAPRSFSAKVYLEYASTRIDLDGFGILLTRPFSGDVGDGPFMVEYHENRIVVKPMTLRDMEMYIDSLARQIVTTPPRKETVGRRKAYESK